MKEELKKYIKKLSWQEFESEFLLKILEALGFQDINITQHTKDGGKDAECTYKMGIVSLKAIVSAKHWNTQAVGPNEVQRVRGISGDADTGIIVATPGFTSGAIAEVEKRTFGHRAIILIDENLIVETCIKEGIGVRQVELPALFEFQNLSQSETAPFSC